MHNNLFLKFSLIYFIFTFFLIIFCHTVANAADVLRQNDSNPKIILEQNKREDKNGGKIGTSTQIRTVNVSDEKASTEVLNITDYNKQLVQLDQFNSTAGLPSWMLNIKEGALQRTGFVALGFMSIVVIFFVVRAVRLRQKRSKSRKYGIITSTASDMEMEPLDRDDDEEEDTTLFDAQHKYSLQ